MAGIVSSLVLSLSDVQGPDGVPGMKGETGDAGSPVCCKYKVGKVHNINTVIRSVCLHI